MDGIDALPEIIATLQKIYPRIRFEPEHNLNTNSTILVATIPTIRIVISVCNVYHIKTSKLVEQLNFMLSNYIVEYITTDG